MRARLMPGGVIVRGAADVPTLTSADVAAALDE
jgi:hypothetical protein